MNDRTLAYNVEGAGVCSKNHMKQTNKSINKGELNLPEVEASGFRSPCLFPCTDCQLSD